MAQYSHRWKETSDLASKEMTAKVWRNAIDGLSDEQLKNGYNQISTGKRYADFPPTPAQFRLLCQSNPDDGRFKTAHGMEMEQDAKERERTDKLSRDRMWFMVRRWLRHRAAFTNGCVKSTDLAIPSFYVLFDLFLFTIN